MVFAGPDLANDYITGQSLAQIVTADANGTGVDCRDGAPEVTLIGTCSAIQAEEDTTVTFELEESSDNSAWTDMTAADGSTALAATAISATVAGPAIITRARRTKRYVRAVANVAGTSVSEEVGAVIMCRKASY